MDLTSYLGRAVEEISRWQDEFGSFGQHGSLSVDEATADAAFAELVARLRDNYPYFHPHYAGQMLKPPHPAAVAGYVAAMLVNPNNHALDGGPATARMEREVVDQLTGMFGFSSGLGHLTTSGTIANLEALFVARELHPGQVIAFSEDAHYTHGRMCHLLGVKGVAVATDGAGRMDLDALEDLLAGGAVGTVVMTAGTTGLGAVDPILDALPLCARHGARIHVDAAYGGFFRLIADDSPDGVAAAPWLAIAECDSVVVDPHKHGLQPYGCGAVLFRDSSVGRLYKHDSPYTYFTSDALHLGEISLECSRAGASAAALWLTMQVVPLTAEGLGAVLRPGLRAARAWADLIDQSPSLTLYQRPELDIVTYFPTRERLSSIDAVSAQVMAAGMGRPLAEAVYLATYTAPGSALAARGHQVDADVAAGRILRSVLMKPESEAAVPWLHQQVCELAAGAPS
jgi:glutamate/tyrosine decarboxylase-like PLP-dependent enzyme